ncbi:MAG: 3-phosphoshikimate 1-carboxyvinyltransferase [Planctomycetes bacterium]|nr:3-phosphoshikimate 1-carboxyvinyltransferase [Planctomycetota bacterium]MBL7145470.1 3-phosphoshikimate 1-carboxyvinyltransferase [Phycisphaerae bacterium]
MKLIVKKSRLKGTVLIPGSKSHTIRAVAIASLAAGESLIHNPLDSSDTQAAVACYRALGAEINISDPKLWKVKGTGGTITPPPEIIDVGNSGTTLRIAMGSASLAQAGQTISFTGDEQIQTRPVGPLMDALAELGAKCTSLKSNGKAPVEIMGKLTGGKTAIAATTSQYLSSLLLCAPLASKDTLIDVTLLNEPGYVQMTLDWLDKQQIEYDNQQMRTFKIKGNQSYKAFDAKIPADFSSATFFLCAAAISAEQVTLLGLDFTDSQPDKAVVDYLKAMGADIYIGPNSVTVKAATLKGTEFDMNKTPDALPAMAVTAAFAKGTTKLLNVPQARNKETDRIKCMAEELEKMDIDVEELPDGLIINGGKPKPAELHGWADHRIVMALSMMGLNMNTQCTIDTAEAISVTFPGYVELMKALGANMEILEC